MNSDQAMEIIKKFTRRRDLNEDEIILMTEALEYMREIEFSYPPAWYFNIAHFYDSIGRYELALKHYKMAIDEGDTVSYMGIADTYRHMHEYKLAYEFYMKAAEAGFKRAYERIEEIRPWI